MRQRVPGTQTDEEASSRTVGAAMHKPTMMTSNRPRGEMTRASATGSRASRNQSIAAIRAAGYEIDVPLLG